MAYEERTCVKYAGACGGQYRIFYLDDGTEVKGTEIDNATRDRFMREARQKYYAEENGSGPGSPVAQSCAARDSREAPSSEEINQLPDHIRDWIHDLETRCDRQGDLRRLRAAEKKAEQAEAALVELEEAASNLLDVCFAGDGRKVYRSTDEELMKAAKDLHAILEGGGSSAAQRQSSPARSGTHDCRTDTNRPMATDPDEAPSEAGQVQRDVTRRDIKIRDARCPKDEEHALQALREFRGDFPGKIGRRSGVIFCSDEVEIYCYRTDTQLVADVQKSAV